MTNETTNDIAADYTGNQHTNNATNPVNCPSTGHYDNYKLNCPWDVYNNVSKNLTAYIECCIGPRTDELVKAIPITILYIITFIVAVVGNLMVCIVIIRNVSMHTATNYYLFNLAVSDLIYLILGIFNEISFLWYRYPYIYGEIYCTLRAFMSQATTYVSVLTIVAFSVERFLAICYPLHLVPMNAFKRAARIIVAIWIISLFSAFPFGWNQTIVYLKYPNGDLITESSVCRPDNDKLTILMFDLAFVVFFLIPLITLIIMYTRMGIVIYFRAKHNTRALGLRNGSKPNDSDYNRTRKAIIKMLALVVLTFFICWTPYQIQRISTARFARIQIIQEINKYFFYISGILYYASCALNPIIYSVMSVRYRTAFHETICGRKQSKYQTVNGFRTGPRGSSVRETFVNESDLADSDRNSIQFQRTQSTRTSQIRKESEVSLK